MKTTTIQRVAATAAWYAGIGHAAVQQTCPATGVCFSVGVPQVSASSGSGNIYFQITAPTSYSWVALGTGSSMTGSNIFVMYQDGHGNLTMSPRLGTGHSQPSLDTSDGAAQLTLLAGSGVSGDTMTANIMCPNCESWNSGKDSMSLSSTSSNWIGAWKSGSSLATSSKSASISIHDSYTSFNLDLTKATISSDSNPFVTGSSTSSGNGNSGSGSGSGSASGNGKGSGTGGSGSSSTGDSSGISIIANGGSNNNLVVSHGVVMAVVMVIFYPCGSLLMPMTGSWQLHAVVQMVAFVLMWVGFGLGFKAANDLNMLFTESHTIFGTVIVCLLIIQPMMGFLHHYLYVRKGGRTAVSYGHIFYGRAMILMGIINGGLGLKVASAPTNLVIAYSVVAAIFSVLYVFGAAYGSSQKSRQAGRIHANDLDKDGIALRTSPNMYDKPRPMAQGREMYR